MAEDIFKWIRNVSQRPTTDKVFREVKQGRVFVLIPVSNAIESHSPKKDILRELNLFDCECAQCCAKLC